MSFDLRNNSSSTNKKVVGSLRRSQIITTHGPGSIVDFPEESVIIAGTNKWENFDNIDDRIHEPNLERFLGVDYFTQPKVTRNKYNLPYKISKDIAAFRFPEMLFCNKCGDLRHYKQFSFNKKPKCHCGGFLVSSRFVVACKNGHIEDFPYSWWVHRKDPGSCNNPNNLKIFSDKKSGGLESIKINCKSCNAFRTMSNAFNKNALSDYDCSGYRPWEGKNSENDNCNETMRTLQKGASNIYFPIHASALSIPPWSEEIQKELSNKWTNIKSFLDDSTLLKRVVIENYNMTERFNCTFEDIKEQINIKLQSENNKPKYKDLIKDEYRAFTLKSYDKGDFKTQFAIVPDLMKSYIDKVVQAKKLREVLALCGFSRIDPDYGNFENFNDNNITNLQHDYSGFKWFPAIEMNGEGLFIEFNTEKINKWEKENKERFKRMKKNLDNSFINKENFSPSYVLLHTFSHLLIRQLILKCGYSSAALKERIYCTYPDDSMDMAGILIYTSTSDSEGSLGGLVKEGEKDRLENTFRNMLDNASWCSSDPICIQSKGQGIDSLNFAACHSCVLLPETSCESNNTLLDRASLIGDLNNKNIGFFSDLFKERDF